MTNESLHEAGSEKRTSRSSYTFGSLLGFSIRKTFSNIPMFFGIILIFSLISVLLLYLWANMAITGFTSPSFDLRMLKTKIFIIAGIYAIGNFVLSFLYTGSMAKAANNVIHDKHTNSFEAIGFSFKNFTKLLGISLRTFWYVFKVAVLPFLVLILVYVLMQMILATGVTNVFLGNIADAAGLLLTEDQPVQLIGEAQGGGMNSNLLSFMMYGLSSLVFIVGGIALILGIYRSIQVIFALFVFVEEGISGKEALEKSIKTVKGKFWKVFLYVLVLGLFLGFVVELPITILTEVFDIAMGSVTYWVFTVISYILYGFMGGVFAVFLNKFYIKLKKA